MTTPKRVRDSTKKTVREDKKQVWEVNGELKVNWKWWENADTSKFETYGNSWSEPKTPLQTYGNDREEVNTIPALESISLGNTIVNEIPIGRSVDYPITISPAGAECNYTIAWNYSSYATAEIKEYSGNKYLSITGTASGNIEIYVTDQKTAIESNHLQITIQELPTVTFDYNPDEVTLTPNGDPISVPVGTAYSAHANVLLIWDHVITATANAGYVFSHWDCGDGGVVDGGTITDDIIFIPYLEPIPTYIDFGGESNEWEASMSVWNPDASAWFNTDWSYTLLEWEVTSVASGISANDIEIGFDPNEDPEDEGWFWNFMFVTFWETNAEALENFSAGDELCTITVKNISWTTLWTLTVTLEWTPRIEFSVYESGEPDMPECWLVDLSTWQGSVEFNLFDCTIDDIEFYDVRADENLDTEDFTYTIDDNAEDPNYDWEYQYTITIEYTGEADLSELEWQIYWLSIGIPYQDPDYDETNYDYIWALTAYVVPE